MCRSLSNPRTQLTHPGPAPTIAVDWPAQHVMVAEVGDEVVADLPDVGAPWAFVADEAVRLSCGNPLLYEEHAFPTVRLRVPPNTTVQAWGVATVKPVTGSVAA